MADEKRTCTSVARKEATALGLKYFDGVSCTYGHTGKRYVSTGQCVECIRVASKKWYGEDRHKHRDVINAKKRRIYRNNKEKILSQNAEYRDRNREAIYAKQNAKYAENKETLGIRRRQSYAANPEAFNARVRKRKALKLGNGGSHTADDVLAIIKAQHGKCAYCKVSVIKRRHVDHIVPLSRGGSNDRRNLQVLCPTCNARKRARDPIDHARSLGLLV